MTTNIDTSSCPCVFERESKRGAGSRDPAPPSAPRLLREPFFISALDLPPRLPYIGAINFNRGNVMLDGFKKFILRGNVVDMAVGVVIGAAFAGVVAGLTKAFIT